MARLLLLNGPNLNLLGSREPEVYGTGTLADIESALRQQAAAAGHELIAVQSNSESTLVETIHQHRDCAWALCNFGAFTHTSVALRDALLGVSLPFYEIHISNVFAREQYRHHSYFSDIARGCVIGLGAQGYSLALSAAIRELG